MHSGTFYYRIRKGDKAISWIVLILTLLTTLLAQTLFDNFIISIIAFFAALIGLSALSIPIINKLFVHKADYEFTPDQLTLHVVKKKEEKEIVVPVSEVTGVTYEAVHDKKVKTADVILYWKIDLITLNEEYEYTSEPVSETNKKNVEHMQEFDRFGKRLKRWYTKYEKSQGREEREAEAESTAESKPRKKSGKKKKTASN